MFIGIAAFVWVMGWLFALMVMLIGFGVAVLQATMHTLADYFGIRRTEVVDVEDAVLYSSTVEDSKEEARKQNRYLSTSSEADLKSYIDSSLL